MTFHTFGNRGNQSLLLWGSRAGQGRDKGTGTCPTPKVREYQVTHFRFLDTNEM